MNFGKEQRKHKHLKDYSDEELREILEHNEQIDASELAFITSEVVRRMMLLNIQKKLVS